MFAKMKYNHEICAYVFISVKRSRLEHMFNIRSIERAKRLWLWLYLFVKIRRPRPKNAPVIERRPVAGMVRRMQVGKYLEELGGDSALHFDHWRHS